MADELVRIGKDSFLEAVAEGAKEIPFAGSVLAVLGGVTRARAELRFQTFLEEIGKPLAFGNVEAVVHHIAQNIEEPWMIDGLERGWKTIIETMDPLARKCAYLMVADYLEQRKPPDRIHRQFGNLLMESDEEILRIFLAIADGLEESTHPYGEIQWVRERHEDIKNPLYHLILGEKRYDPLPSAAREASEILIRNSFASVFSGIAPDHPDPAKYQMVDVLCTIRFTKASLWKRVRSYLAPVRQRG